MEETLALETESGTFLRMLGGIYIYRSRSKGNSVRVHIQYVYIRTYTSKQKSYRNLPAPICQGSPDPQPAVAVKYFNLVSTLQADYFISLRRSVVLQNYKLQRNNKDMRQNNLFNNVTQSVE